MMKITFRELLEPILDMNIIPFYLIFGGLLFIYVLYKTRLLHHIKFEFIWRLESFLVKLIPKLEKVDKWLNKSKFKISIGWSIILGGLFVYVIYLLITSYQQREFWLYLIIAGIYCCIFPLSIYRAYKLKTPLKI